MMGSPRWVGSTVLKTVATTRSPLDGQSCKSERISWKCLENTCYGIIAAEALNKAVSALPSSTGINKKNTPHAACGSQFFVFVNTYSARASLLQFHSTRARTRSKVPREQEWQYDRRSVAKGGKGTNACGNNRSHCFCECYENH